MSEIIKEYDKDRAKQEELRILKEIEESFCVAGYDILEIAVEQLSEKVKHA